MNQSRPLGFLKFPLPNSLPRGMLFGGILLGALLAFEIFNYSTTDFALTDLLGSELTFAGFRWATILSVAFCGIDFAGIARLFTPEKGQDEPAEVWYLFGAWLLAALMNASLTWWGISVAVMGHTAQGSELIGHTTLTKGVPVFVAAMVWLIRVLIIGTFSLAGEKIFSMDQDRVSRPSSPARQAVHSARPASVAPHLKPRPASAVPATQYTEPTYHPVGMSASSPPPNKNIRH